MITLTFNVDDQVLTRTDGNTVAANSHMVHKCDFTFSSEWDGRGKVATFKKRDILLSVIIEDDSCIIPPEVLQSKKKIDMFEVSVCGANPNSTITSSIVKIPMIAGTWDATSEEITPTMFEQIMQKIEEIEKGEVPPELIYEAVGDWMEEHPMEPIIAEDVAAYFAAHHDEFKGDKGDTGATPMITAEARIDNNTGTPRVIVGCDGPAENRTFQFQFKNLKGAKGDTGATPNIAASASVDANVGTPAVNVTKTGTAENPTLTFAFSNLKGETGNGIASIAKTSTSGLVDTYTITFTSGNTTTFTVNNGLGIKSADINASGHLIITFDDDTTYDAGALSDTYATVTDVDTKVNDVWKAQGYLGAKNLLQYPYKYLAVNSYESNGITYNINDDGSITINGTNTNYSACNLLREYGLLDKNVPYIMSAQGLTSGVEFQIGYLNNGTFVNKVNCDSTRPSKNFTITDEYDGKQIGIRIVVTPNSVVDNITIYPMIRIADDTDDTWQPYAPTNADLNDKIKESVKYNGKMGAKNLLCYPYSAGSGIIRGVQITVNDDGSVTLNGTAETNIYFGLSNESIRTFGDKSFNSKGTQSDVYIASLENGSSNIYINYNVNDKQTTLVITKDTVCDNLTVYPMIRYVEDIDDTWQPYAPTNYELMQKDNALADSIANIGKRLWGGSFSSGSIEVVGAAKYTVFLMEINSAFFALGSRTNGVGGYAITGYTIQQGGYKLGATTNGDNIVFTIDSTNDGASFNGQSRPITRIYGLF